MTVFINSEIGNFISAAITGGIAWDLIKIGGRKYFLAPLLSALEKLNNRNQEYYGGLRILRLKLQFDDCEIRIGGLNRNFTSVISTVFNEVSKLKPRFEQEIGQEVIKIELPVYYSEDKEQGDFFLDVHNETYTIETFKNMWRIIFSTEYPVMIYNFEMKKLFEPEEMVAKIKNASQ